MGKRGSRGPPKLPSKQLAILAICRFAEPVAMTSVFPYMPEMIESFGVDKKSVPKWAGITSAVFSLSQCLTAILWGRASDTFGRKVAILTGLSCTMVSTLVWGLSSTLPMAIVARAMAGAFNGNVGIIRTMVAEIVPEKELQPRAFSIMPLVWSLGSIFGPSFGGFFAKPAEHMSGLFGNNKLLIKYPFLLPNIMASILFTIGISTGFLFLKESLETKRHKKDIGLILGNQLTKFVRSIFHRRRGAQPYRHLSHSQDESSASLLHRPSTSSSHASPYPSKPTKPALPRPSMKEVFTRQSVINLIVYTFLALHNVAYDQLLPIFLHNPRQKPDSSNTHMPLKFSGGFGLNSDRIGTIFTLYGICGCFIQFLVFPPVAKRMGVLNCFKCCGITFPVVCFITPYTALIQNPTLQILSLVPILLIRSICVIFAFPSSVILLTNSASSLRILGTLNGFAVSVSAVGRAIGPALGGATFTWGLERGYVIPPWWLLGTIAAIGAVPIWWLEEMPGFSKAGTDSDSDLESDTEDEEALLPNTQDDHHEGAILAGDEVLIAGAEEALDVVDGPPLARTWSRGTGSATGTGASRGSGRRGSTVIEGIERRMSSPIGLRESVGPGGGSKLSNALASSNMGQGTGGTSFA